MEFKGQGVLEVEGCGSSSFCCFSCSSPRERRGDTSSAVSAEEVEVSTRAVAAAVSAEEVSPSFAAAMAMLKGLNGEFSTRAVVAAVPLLVVEVLTRATVATTVSAEEVSPSWAIAAWRANVMAWHLSFLNCLLALGWLLLRALRALFLSKFGPYS